jgi:hypothetical protein
MKMPTLYSILIVMAAGLLHAGNEITYNGDGSDLQKVIDAAPKNSVIICDIKKQYNITKTIRIDKPLTVKGLNLLLPKGVKNTVLIHVVADDVTLMDIKVRGNAPMRGRDSDELIRINGNRFRVERLTMHDANQNGLIINPAQGKGDLVGGTIKDVKAFRVKRDAVSVAGIDGHQRVRDVTVDNVSLIEGKDRGPVEVSDGTDNIRVTNVFAKKCFYAVDVQDHHHLENLSPNTNIHLENIEAVDCTYIIKTPNIPRGHKNLVMKNISGSRCEVSIVVANTENVLLDGLVVTPKPKKKPAKRNRWFRTLPEEPVQIVLVDCKNVVMKGVVIEGLAKPVVLQTECTGVVINGKK